MVIDTDAPELTPKTLEEELSMFRYRPQESSFHCPCGLVYTPIALPELPAREWPGLLVCGTLALYLCVC